MSSALVRKSLALIDSDCNSLKEAVPSNRRSISKDFIHNNQKIIKRVQRKGQKVERVNVLETHKKLSVVEARKKCTSQEVILKNNLHKLKLIKEATKITLDREIIKQLIERAVTRRPIKAKKKNKKQKTAFTEEDFKKFEQEYCD